MKDSCIHPFRSVWFERRQMSKQLWSFLEPRKMSLFYVEWILPFFISFRYPRQVNGSSETYLHNSSTITPCREQALIYLFSQKSNQRSFFIFSYVQWSKCFRLGPHHLISYAQDLEWGIPHEQCLSGESKSKLEPFIFLHHLYAMPWWIYFTFIVSMEHSKNWMERQHFDF